MTRQAEAGPRPRRAAYALAVAVALCFGGRGEATCGSHVRFGHEPEPIRPCAGPECSQAPGGAPILPPAPAPTLDHDALLPGAPAPAAGGARFHRPQPSHLLPLHDDSPPSPPPRPSAR